MRKMFVVALLCAVGGCKRSSGPSIPDGRVLCWGLDQSGQLGARSDDPFHVAPDGADAAALFAAESTTCARGASGSWKCWGDTLDEVAPLFAMAGATSVRAAKHHACALLPNGTVACTGDDARRAAFEAANVPDPMTSKQLYAMRTDEKGNVDVKPVGHVAPQPTVDAPPYVILKNVNDAVEVAVGSDHACARHATGAVSCWGQSTYGQIGNGIADQGTTYGSPQPVAAITDATAIAAGGAYSCAVRAGGTVWCWGILESTLSSATPHATPEQIAGVSGATAIAITTDQMGDEQRACAVIADGGATCWTAREQPYVVKGVSGITQIVAGMAHICARLATGHAACWGHDHNGEIHPGRMNAGPTPQIAGLTNVAEIAVGARHTCVRRGN